MKKNVSIAILLLAFLVLSTYLLFTTFGFVKERKLTRVTVSGESQTQVPPDNAVVTFSIITKDKQAVTAQQQNAKKSETVITAIKELIPANAEVKTDNYRLDAEQNYSETSLSKIVGYEAQNSITVITPDLNQVGALIDAATKAGANSIDGINFVLREDSPNRGNSLGVSTRQAMAKAEAIAQSLGGKIYRVVEAREGGVNTLPTTENFSSFANAAANTTSSSYKTQVMAGSINMRSSISLIVDVESN